MRKNLNYISEICIIYCSIILMILTKLCCDQEEMERNRKSSGTCPFHCVQLLCMFMSVHSSETVDSKGSESGGGSGTRMREVACPTCTVHLQVCQKSFSRADVRVCALLAFIQFGCENAG
jgi:hypothetical protein